MKVEEIELEKNETNVFEKEKMGTLPKEFFEGVLNQIHVTFEIFMLLKRLTKPITKLPEAIWIHRLRELESDKYALRKVLFLQIEKTEDGETFVAKIPSLEIFGVGDTQEEAIRDFQLSLIEDYEILKEERDNLSNYLQSHFATLTKILRELPCR